MLWGLFLGGDFFSKGWWLLHGASSHFGLGMELKLSRGTCSRSVSKSGSRLERLSILASEKSSRAGRAHFLSRNRALVAFSCLAFGFLSFESVMLFLRFCPWFVGFLASWFFGRLAFGFLASLLT